MDQDDKAERFAEEPDQMPPSFPPVSREAAREERVADVEAEETPEEEQRSTNRFASFALEFFTVIAVALLISVIIKTFFLQAFAIPSESMENTLIPGDRILVNKLASDEEDLNRGDIVVFVDPGGWLDDLPPDNSPKWKQLLTDVGETIGILPQNVGDHLVKRIIGIPGDHVVCCNEEGMISVNGEPVVETYVKSGTNPSDQEFDVVVPNGHVWVLGDNRANSKDSRFHQQASGFGFVPISNIEGRAWLMVLPLDRFGSIGHADGVFDSVPDSD